MIEGHQKEIATFSEQAKGSNESDVTELAAKTLPTLQKHLQIAQSLQK